jgi:hypothetical protein
MKFSRFAAVLSLLIVCATMSIAQTFESAPFMSTGAQPAAVAVGDFNHDGKLDMVVANSGDSRYKCSWETAPGSSS